MRLTFVIYSLGPGGAERVVSTMANYWAERRWQITILTLKGAEDAPFYDLHSEVEHRPLGLAANSPRWWEKVFNNARRLMVLRRAIRETTPDMVISFMNRTNVLTVLALLGADTPAVVAEVNDPHHRPLAWGWETLRTLTYRRADRVVVQSQHIKSYYPAAVRERCSVVPNPIALPQGTDAEPVSVAIDGRKVALAMGRLVEVKGFDLLLRAFGRISTRHPLWSLQIWGDGPQRDRLETLVAEMRLKGRVRLCGQTRQPFQRMREADLFILSSRSEGFGNVVGEALACGLPVISFDTAGPHEIIRDGVDGILVPPGDVNALALAMDRLMSDEVERGQFAERAPEVLRRFGVARVMPMWEAVIRDAARVQS